MFKWLTNRFKKGQSSFEQYQLLVEGGATWTNHNYEALAREGYCRNIIAYHCINSIANGVADVPIIIRVDGEELSDDTNDVTLLSIEKVLKRPNPKQSYKPFMAEAVSHRLIGGNTYMHLNKGDIYETAEELTLFRPDWVYIELKNFIPVAYVYTLNGKKYRYPIDLDTNISEVLQMKTFNPLCPLYGLSPISAASMSIDQHNEASEWNKSLLENASKPAGILSMRDRGDNAPSLTPEQQALMSRQVNDKFAGPGNSGKIITLNYDMQWQSLSFSPTDMDWLNGKQATARDICLAFNYPAMLLGFPEGSTFNNVSEAKLSLYEETIIPLLNSMLEEMSHWLSLSLNINLEIVPDLDKVSALAPRREMARNNARLDLAAGVITTNEARLEGGYDEYDGDGADEIMVPAAKLPLSFDMTGLNDTTSANNAKKDITKMSDKEFFNTLIDDGFDADGALKLTALTINRAKE